MNYLSQNSQIKINCFKHPNKKIQLIKKNQIRDNDKLLLCSKCLDDIEDFKIQNYIWIDDILDIDDNDIIEKWPILQDDSLHQKISSFTQINKDIDFSEEILLFFEKLKLEIIQKIEDIKKQLIGASQKLPQQQNHLIEEIKKLSQTNELKQILIDSKNNYKQIEDKLRQFIQKVELQKQNNTEIVKNLIEQYEKNLQIFDLKIRDQFTSLFHQLIPKVDDFFQQFNANQKSYDILQEMQMIKTNFQKSQEYLQIVKSQNNQISISQSEDKVYTNCVSNFILDENTHYVFRFQIINNSQTEKSVNIGLVRDSKKDSANGYSDKLTCYFQIDQNQFYKSGWGIDKKEKGDWSVLRQNQKEIEMRVCIKNGILQILDYPNYNHILSITDQYKQNLQEYKNLRLNISHYNKDLNINLTHAYKSSFY